MKRLILAIIVALLLIATVGSGVLAAKGAVKTPLYPVAGGDSANVLTDQPAQGKVIVNTPKGSVTLNFTVVAKGLTSSQFYTVWIRDLTGYTGDSYNSYEPLGYYLLGGFTTDIDGKGSFHANIRADDLPSGGYNIQVAINNGTFEVIGSTVIATEKYTAVTTGK